MSLRTDASGDRAPGCGRAPEPGSGPSVAPSAGGLCMRAPPLPGSTRERSGTYAGTGVTRMVGPYRVVGVVAALHRSEPTQRRRRGHLRARPLDEVEVRRLRAEHGRRREEKHDLLRKRVLLTGRTPQRHITNRAGSTFGRRRQQDEDRRSRPTDLDTTVTRGARRYFLRSYSARIKVAGPGTAARWSHSRMWAQRSGSGAMP